MPLIAFGFFGTILLAILKLTLLVPGLTWGLVLLPWALSVAAVVIALLLFWLVVIIAAIFFSR